MKELKIKNTVVLSGFMLKDYNLKTLGEFDFIVISSSSRSIIQIEAKRGNSEKNREHAEKQLKRGQEFFEQNLPFPSSENWSYTKMMCFGESVEREVCTNCKQFVLGADFYSSEKTIQTVSREIAKQFTAFLNTIPPKKGMSFNIHFFNKVLVPFIIQCFY